jgi:hypothetical protein
MTTDPRILSALRRIERNTLLLQIQGMDIMATFTELEAKIDALTAGQAEAKADAARHEARTVAAVALVQDLRQALIDAQANAGGATPAQINALVAKVDAGLVDMEAANAQRDAADDTLGAGITPA